MANNAKLFDPTVLIQAGVDPKTGLPVKYKSEDSCFRKENIRKNLRILDEQDAINRYLWRNAPLDLSSQDIERLLYYKGQLCFFFHPRFDKFFLLPYALDGGLDIYGRFVSVHPVPFTTGTDEEKNKLHKAQADYFSTLKLEVLYDIPDEPINFFEGKHCVLVHDYSKQLSQTIISRQILNDPIVDIESDIIPYMRTALMSSTGIQGMRVPDADAAAAVYEASMAIDDAALTGKKMIPVKSSIELQDLTGGNIAKAEEFLLALQSIDNFRLSLYGLDNGGLFQKKSHMLEAEQEMNAGATSIPLTDGLTIRQRFCDIVNSVTAAGISCEISETVLGADKNGDGLITDEVDQSGSSYGDQDYMEGGY